MISLCVFSLKRNLGKSNKGTIISRGKRSFFNNKYFFVDNYYFNLSCSYIENQIFIVTKVFSNFLYKNSLLIKCNNLSNDINLKRIFIKAQKVNKGDTIKLLNTSLLNNGDSSYIYKLTYGNVIFNIEGSGNNRSTYCKSFNSYSTIVFLDSNNYFIKLPSNQVKKVNRKCKVFLGKPDGKNIDFLFKAGNSYKFGIRPVVRGKAMNCVDHPHGGGEGKTSIGRSSIFSIYGKALKGIKTSKRKW